MARAIRIALDMALGSIKFIRPVITKAWVAARNKLGDTKAKSLVDNKVVVGLETFLESSTSRLQEKLEEMRYKQLPKEKQYLEQELQKVNKMLQGGYSQNQSGSSNFQGGGSCKPY